MTPKKINKSFNISEEPKKEPRKIEKVEAPKRVVEKATIAPTVLVSELDAQIRERMKSQPQTLDEVKVKSSLLEQGVHLLTLPKELKPYEKEYAFYWLGKDKRKIDRGLDVRGWVIVNKTIFPNLPEHLFSISGAIERGDAILCCMAKEKAEALRKGPQDKASELLRATLDKPKMHPDMYEAKISTSEENEESPSGLVEGRDF